MRMDYAVLSRFRVAAFRMTGKLVFLLLGFVLLWAQVGPPRPPKASGPGAANRIADIRRTLDSPKAVDVTAQRAIEYSRGFLASAEKALRLGEFFSADRLAESADALLHVAEHQQHLLAGVGPKGPPPAEETREHLQRVYFRTQQADYFLSQSHDSRATAFPKWARDFYQLAVRDYERGDLIAADENAKCAEEIVKALENLAQAATNSPPPAKPPGPKDPP